MKLIKPSFEILEQEVGLEGMYKQIEKVGRTCYKSEDKIAEGTAKPFVDRMVKSKHLAMCEHGTLYFKIPVNIDVAGDFLDEIPTWTKCRLIESQEGNWWAITTNLRVMIEHFAPEYTEELIEKYLCEPTEYHVKRVTVKFTCDRGVSHEFVRHRVFSFAQESTRYCNYSKDKFGNELTFIIPCWSKSIEGNYGTLIEPLEIQFKEYDEDVFEREFINELINIEFRYINILNAGYTPQQARAILPNSLKTELVMTGFVNDWEHFFDLRARGTTGAPHPQAKELAEPLLTEFIKRGILSL